jgi:hypothetical protein
VSLLLAPQVAGLDQGADGVVIPQQCLGLGAVQTAISPVTIPREAVPKRQYRVCPAFVPE